MTKIQEAGIIKKEEIEGNLVIAKQYKLGACMAVMNYYHCY